MEHKIYKYEIVLGLLKKRNHLRGIAKELKINHMTVKRVLDKLVKENILDVKQEGRNNVFSIKKTLEAENYVLRAELYKFNKFINKHTFLKLSLKELRKTNVGLVVIFGSYAKGLETKDSDVDIYIATNKRTIRKWASKINEKFSVKIGKYDKKNLLIKEIEKDHVIVKGVELFYEKNKFFD